MPKKKSQNKNFTKDFTINDCANAPKPVGRVKKSTAKKGTEEDIPWDQVPDDEYDNIHIEESNADGTKSISYKKKKNGSKSKCQDSDPRPGNVYPEIIFHQISKYIKPEDVGVFAGINKTTYAITKKKSFWQNLYTKYCETCLIRLPERYRIENSYKTYGLRQRVIRALFYTYDKFVVNMFDRSFHCSLHELVHKRCVSVWFNDSMWLTENESLWVIYFKFKKVQPAQNNGDLDIIKELGRIDANTEESMQVLEVCCKTLNAVPPLMGMTLSSIKMSVFSNHQMVLSFNSEKYPVSKDILPECTVMLDSVKTFMVMDWWHPHYPYFENRLPRSMGDEEALPVLKTDFFSMPVKV